jgi:TRAP-type mannitol/chloroaromatic compound transport system permease small subunit
MKKTVQVIESISEWTGKISMWFCLFLVLMLTWEVVMRYGFSRPTIYSYEISTMMGVIIAAGGLAFAHKYHGHVRVDVFWKNLSPRGKAIADVICAWLFFFPFTAAIVYISGKWALRSIIEKEILTATYLYPPAWPIRTVMMLGFLLFIPQGIAKMIRDLYLITKGKEL